MRRALMGLAVIALAGCGGGSKSPSVASLGSSPPSTAAAASTGGPGKNDIVKMQAYASCIRAHGVPDFPDPVAGPNGGVGFQIKGGPGSDVDPNGAKMQAADKVCKSLLPNGGVAQPIPAAQQQKFLDWAACIRAHGVPGFPDPDFSGGGVRVRVPAGSGAPGAFQAAQTACKSKFPGLGGGPGPGG